MNLFGSLVGFPLLIVVARVTGVVRACAAAIAFILTWIMTPIVSLIVMIIFLATNYLRPFQPGHGLFVPDQTPAGSSAGFATRR